MRVALFVHHFLEPTHHAIATLLNKLEDCEFWVFGKELIDREYFQIGNITNRTFYRKGSLPAFAEARFELAHIIYDGNMAFEAAAVARSAKVPFVLSFHGGFDTKAKMNYPAYRAPTRLIAEQAATITAVSAGDVRRLKEIGINRSITIVPVPVDLSILPPPGRLENYKLISVARLINKKGIDISVRALALLPIDYTLIVVGDGPERKSLTELAEALDVSSRITWIGRLQLNQTLRTLASCGVLLHPSRTSPDGNADGTPQIILWAQAMGIPVISTFSGDIPELITPNETGLLVEPNDPASLAQAVARINSNRELAARVMAQAQRKVREGNDMEKIVNQWRRIYLDVALPTN